MGYAINPKNTVKKIVEQYHNLSNQILPITLMIIILDYKYLDGLVYFFIFLLLMFRIPYIYQNLKKRNSLFENVNLKVSDIKTKSFKDSDGNFCLWVHHVDEEHNNFYILATRGTTNNNYSIYKVSGEDLIFIKKIQLQQMYLTNTKVKKALRDLI